MTTIDRLGVLGIRSYGTDEECVIKFYKPLTIILGRNGSGKSSIIEAVKMATTGDLPPMVDKGAAFIHDPRIDNQTDTRAKIRLMFTNIRGDQYLIARHFQLAIKKGPRGVGYKTEFKTLDQTLRRVDASGSKAMTSYRCADMNAILPDVLRVSKPVLNNVIFVHQEDSFWPLGDTKKLKEKFDEIFAATRYTKALDTIRKYRKEQAAELRTVNVELMHYGQKVEAFTKLRNELNEMKQRRDELQKGVDALDTEIGEKKKERDAADTIACEYEAKQAELKNLEIKAAIIETEKKEKFGAMENHLPDMTDENIRLEMAELRNSLDRAGTERAQRAGLIDDLSADIELKRNEFLNRQSRKGMLQQQAKMHADRISQLEAMKKELANGDTFGKPLTNKGREIVVPTSSSRFEEWTTALEAVNQDAEKHLQDITAKGNANIDKANERLSSIKVRLESAKADQQRKATDIVNKRKQLTDLRNEIRELEDSQVSVEESQTKLEAAEKLFTEKTKNSSVRKIEDDITKNRRKIVSLREDLSVNRRKREQLVQDQTEQARLELGRETAQTKKKHLASISEEFTELLVSSIDDLTANDKEVNDLSDLREDLKESLHSSDLSSQDRRRKMLEASTRILARRDVLIKDAERRINDIRVSLHSVSSQKAELSRQLNETKQELSDTDTVLSTTTSDLESFSDSAVTLDKVVEMFQNVRLSSAEPRHMVRREHVAAIQDTVQEVDTAVVKTNQKISQIESGRLLAEADLDQFEGDSKHRCPACGVSSSKKVEDMRSSLQHRVQYFRNPESLRKAQQDLKKLESAAQVIRKLHTHCSAAFNTCKSFASTSEKLEEVQKTESAEKSKSDQAIVSFDALRKSIGSNSPIDQISSKVLEVKQAFSECERAEREVALLQSSLSASTGETMSLSEVDSKVREIEEEMQFLQEDVERGGRTLDREKEDLRRAENRVHVAKQQALEQQTMFEKLKRLQMEKADLRKTIDSTEKEIEQLRVMVSTMNVELGDAEAEFHSVRADNMLGQREANVVLNSRQSTLQSWKSCLREVEAYNRSGKKQEFDNLCSSLEVMEADIKAKSADLKAYEKEQQVAADSQKEMEAKIRNLRDNQRYRLQEQEQRINSRSMRHAQESIAELEKAAGEFPPAKVQRLTDGINKKDAQRHATMGRRQVYSDRCKEKQREVTAAEKEGSKRKFDECRIKKQTLELASGDLEKYHRALDQALMAFHTLKMSSINRTIKELWQQTYRGTDIDEIEISSDNEMLNGATSGVLKRSFQYRVRMRQGQATLDMRGRCSAGQKVLACLVIRLALAESFCSDCGILALDEPTTNLDRENVNSLGQALKTIIENRRQQRNFQLVLITHDEEFIEMIEARGFCNEFIKVFKDSSGLSRAKIESLQEAMG